MADRTDIDALLIGALYGELTPADEARLAAHLESHPGDRTALTDLTRTREAVRESRIRAEQAEPSQAISALLLQEASRRAPRAPARDPESESWFQRLFRSTIVAHPAMAAAATLVLVVGAAGTLYLHGSVPFVASESTVTASAPVAATAAAESRVTVGLSESSAAGPRAAAAAGSAADSYRVDVDPPGDDTRAARPAAAAPPELREAKTKTAAESGAEPSKLDDTAPAPASGGAAPGRARGIELRSAQPQPKELPYDSSETARPREVLAKPAAPVSGRTAAASPPSATGNDSDLARRRAADEEDRAERTAVAGAPSPAPPPPAAASAANAVSSAGELVPDSSSSRDAAKPAPNAAPLDGAKVAKRAPTRADNLAPSGGLTSDKPAADPAVLDWARKQRERVVALVAANNCRGAAAAAVEISRRAPDYYAASIATDRAIRPCMAYINSERQRDDRNRAVKNNASGEYPAQAAPPARK